VLLNLNDALHYAREDVIEAYCRMFGARFPRIDYLFCGYGSASYFPNCFRVPGKDDLKGRREARAQVPPRTLRSSRASSRRSTPSHSRPRSSSPTSATGGSASYALKMPKPELDSRAAVR